MSVHSYQVQCPGGRPYTIQAGDTLYVLARRFDTTVNAIVAANPGINPQNLRVGQVICIPGAPSPGPAPCPGGRLYTIQSGDTFYDLARRFDIPLESLLRANPGLDPDRLQVGQQICIPGAAPPPGPEPGLTLPCCSVLRAVPEADLPPAPIVGSVVFTNVPRSTGYSAMTFAATGLPEPSTLGEFDAWIGLVTMSRDPGEPPLRFSVPLDSTEPLDDPLTRITWSGTREIPEQPQRGDVVEVRTANLADAVTGPAVLRGSLDQCAG